MSATEPAGPSARVAGCIFVGGRGREPDAIGAFKQLARAARAGSSLDKYGAKKTIEVG